jgi:hypothetical protein
MPAHGQISQFTEACVAVDRVVKARNHGTTSIGHAVTQKLPGAVFNVV